MCECRQVHSGRNSTHVESKACTRWIDPAARTGYVLRPDDSKVVKEGKDLPGVELVSLVYSHPMDDDDDPLGIYTF